MSSVACCQIPFNICVHSEPITARRTWTIWTEPMSRCGVDTAVWGSGSTDELIIISTIFRPTWVFGSLIVVRSPLIHTSVACTYLTTGRLWTRRVCQCGMMDTCIQCAVYGGLTQLTCGKLIIISTLFRPACAFSRCSPL